MSDFIKLETKYLEITKNEYLSTAFHREKFEFDSIPTNCIFDKTLPGLGATYSEIEAKRSSIIIEPNIPVIDGKVDSHKNLLGVYEGCSDVKIKNYLLSHRIEHKKIPPEHCNGPIFNNTQACLMPNVVVVVVSG